LLRQWLEDRRKELEATTGRELPRPTVKSGEAVEEVAERVREVRALMARLIANLPADEADWTPENRARWLLAQMLEWHRREDKSAWSEYFRLCKLSDAELQQNNDALGGLIYIGEVRRIKQSIVHRYSFPPQDHAMDRALEAHDPTTHEEAGKILEINERDRTVDIKRGIASAVPHPNALIPCNIIKSRTLPNSLLRLATDVADHGFSALGHFQAARDLLLRRRPRPLKGATGSLIGEDGQLTEAAKTLVLALPQEASVLAIQGPPGSGKTFTGARMIVELANQGKRVGVTAPSHKVISSLLLEVCKAASEAGVSVGAVQKPNEEDGCKDPMVLQAKTNEAVLAALTSGAAQVAGGTAFLWGRGEMARSVDVWFVDEAGQMSLANVLAISHAATSVVLLGDPRQLDQPQRGVHPPGTEVSALGHLLHGNSTIAVDQGIFLTETRRLHPDVCAFTSALFYDGRLLPCPENEKQRVNARGLLDGTGLRFVPVEHFGNQNESQEEVETVTRLVEELLRTGTTWTNKKGETLPLELKDILIVAPYNVQVSALAQRLPTGARVGTVDKFQGQEAPVVFYSMATSTPEDAPRGMEFLYSLNRLNVATSRAQCVAAIVASPALFRVQCKTPRQIELANAFCRYIELARLAGG
jgi:hypothetical protein